MDKPDNIDQTPKNAVGVFEDHGIQIFIYAKKNESNEEAIKRVAEKHHVPADAIKILKK